MWYFLLRSFAINVSLPALAIKSLSYYSSGLCKGDLIICQVNLEKNQQKDTPFFRSPPWQRDLDIAPVLQLLDLSRDTSLGSWPVKATSTRLASRATCQWGHLRDNFRNWTLFCITIHTVWDWCIGVRTYGSDGTSPNVMFYY